MEHGMEQRRHPLAKHKRLCGGWSEAHEPLCLQVLLAVACGIPDRAVALQARQHPRELRAHNGAAGHGEGLHDATTPPEGGGLLQLRDWQVAPGLRDAGPHASRAWLRRVLGFSSRRRGPLHAGECEMPLGRSHRLLDARRRCASFRPGDQLVQRAALRSQPLPPVQGFQSERERGGGHEEVRCRRLQELRFRQRAGGRHAVLPVQTEALHGLRLFRQGGGDHR
mmetsp:Transcript_35960/g.99068  ORF Transcript_35960/g.99068 Transcript_35960/m.99068 type:complete len:224 (+) Transcript_35960:224-895(+)